MFDEGRSYAVYMEFRKARHFMGGGKESKRHTCLHRLGNHVAGLYNVG